LQPFLASVLVQDGAGAATEGAETVDIHEEMQSSYGTLKSLDAPASNNQGVKDRGASAVSDSESV
jgi:hypothetical protein